MAHGCLPGFRNWIPRTFFDFDELDKVWVVHQNAEQGPSCSLQAYDALSNSDGGEDLQDDGLDSLSEIWPGER